MNSFHRNSRSRRARSEDSDFESFYKTSRRKRQDHKNAQLCRQVFRTLSSAIASAPWDALLDVSLESVDPSPDSSRLLITLRQSASSQIPPVEIIGALERMKGKWRSEIADAISRKRAPELAFALLPQREAHNE